MSDMRLYSGLPIDRLMARLAVILHHLVAGPVNLETFRDLSILALNAGISIDVGGDCEGQIIKAEDLIEALKRAEETNDSEISTFGKPLSAKRLTTYVHRQIVEAKNQQAIRNLINTKKLACKHCQIWYTLSAEGKKVGCIYKNCGRRKEVYEDSPACTQIDPVEEVTP